MNHQPGAGKAREDHEGIFALVQSTLTETLRQAAILSTLTTEVHAIMDQMNSLTKILRGDGDGERGMVMRMAFLEQTTKATSETVREVKSALDSRTTEDQRGRWDMTKSVIVAIIAFVAAIVGAIVNNFFRGIGK